MVNGIGSGGGGLGREAILAAMKSVAKQASEIQGEMQSSALESGPAGLVQESEKAQGFTEKLAETLKSVDTKIKGVENLPQDLINGKVESIHEIAVQMKQAQFSFRFAMEIRNKLVESYREVMRMNV